MSCRPLHPSLSNSLVPVQLTSDSPRTLHQISLSWCSSMSQPSSGVQCSHNRSTNEPICNKTDAHGDLVFSKSFACFMFTPWMAVPCLLSTPAGCFSSRQRRPVNVVNFSTYNNNVFTFINFSVQYQVVTTALQVG